MIHTEMTAIQCLLRNKQKVTAATITVTGNVGLKQWAAIDCLVNHHNFALVRKDAPKKQEENV
jgi:hypothetical protein